MGVLKSNVVVTMLMVIHSISTLHHEFHTILFIDNATCTKRDVKKIKILTKQSYVFHIFILSILDG